jgi:hypothetical protein
MTLILKDYLSEKEVNHIKEHTYKTTGYSWLDTKINPFWELCAKRLPYVSHDLLSYFYPYFTTGTYT